MHLYQAGLPLPTISEWLGHSNIEMSRFYVKVTEAMKKEAPHKLSDSDSSVFKDDVVFKYANDEDSKLYPSNVKTASYSPQTINIPAHVTRVSITIQRSRVQNFPINSFVLEMGMGNMVLRVLSVYSLLNK